MSAACCLEETVHSDRNHMGAVLIVDHDLLTRTQAVTQHERKPFEVFGFQLTSFLQQIPPQTPPTHMHTYTHRNCRGSKAINTEC